jgi:protein Xni
MVLLIDGLNLIRRVYAGVAGHGVKAIAEQDINVADVYTSVTRSVARALRRFEPSHALLVMDSAGTSWRHQLFAQYKANRGPMPELLANALADIEAAVAAIDVRAVRVDSVEADDVIATIALGLAGRAVPAMVLSTDKSMLALLAHGVRVYHHFDSRELDEAYVAERFGIKAAQLPDYLALAGDSTQNVPGVRGIGSKTAQSLLQRFDSLDAVLENLGHLPARQANAIRNQIEDLHLYRRISTLRGDIVVGMNLNDFRLRA